jgi:hypothetical protein
LIRHGVVDRNLATPRDRQADLLEELRSDQGDRVEEVGRRR